MKRKGVLIACLLALLCGCGGSGRIAEIDREETYESGMAALAVVVSSIEELYDLAEAVAEVDVTDAACGGLTEKGAGHEEKIRDSRIACNYCTCRAYRRFLLAVPDDTGGRHHTVADRFGALRLQGLFHRGATPYGG